MDNHDETNGEQDNAKKKQFNCAAFPGLVADFLPAAQLFLVPHLFRRLSCSSTSNQLAEI